MRGLRFAWEGDDLDLRLGNRWIRVGHVGRSLEGSWAAHVECHQHTEWDTKAEARSEVEREAARLLLEQLSFCLADMKEVSKLDEEEIGGALMDRGGATPEEIETMKHMLGFGRTEEPGWRNYGCWATDNAKLAEMERKGLVERLHTINNGRDTYWRVTTRWAETLGARLR